MKTIAQNEHHSDRRAQREPIWTSSLFNRARWQGEEPKFNARRYLAQDVTQINITVTYAKAKLWVERNTTQRATSVSAQ